MKYTICTYIDINIMMIWENNYLKIDDIVKSQIMFMKNYCTYTTKNIVIIGLGICKLTHMCI